MSFKSLIVDNLMKYFLRSEKYFFYHCGIKLKSPLKLMPMKIFLQFNMSHHANKKQKNEKVK